MKMQKQDSRGLRLLALVATSAAALGCDELTEQLDDFLPAEASEEASNAADSTDLSSLEAALVAATTEPLTIGDDEEAIAAEAQALAETIFAPSSCVESVAAGSTVTYTLNNCTGPYGLVQISGVANLAFTVAGFGSVAVAFTAVDLQVNDATLGINVTGDLAVDEDGTKTWDLISTGGGATADGEPMTRTGAFQMTTTERCITLNGNWETTIGVSLWSTTVADFTRCEGACPESGVIVWAGVDGADSSPGVGRAVTVTFDGDGDAAWVTAGGRFGQTPLACGAISG